MVTVEKVIDGAGVASTNDLLVSKTDFEAGLLASVSLVIPANLGEIMNLNFKEMEFLDLEVTSVGAEARRNGDKDSFTGYAWTFS
ncbi:UNVERIFIED_CONTAM: hypothetical protein K2H54_055755 [Gekko kuhli]